MKLIDQAVPNAKADRELVDLLYSMRRDFASMPRATDLKPSPKDIASGRLAPSDATQIGRRRLEPGDANDAEIWFSLPLGLTDADKAVQEHLRSLQWYVCPPANPRARHDEIVVSGAAADDPHVARAADQHFYASLRNEWDLEALLYAQGSQTTNVVYRVDQIDMGPLCTESAGVSKPNGEPF